MHKRFTVAPIEGESGLDADPTGYFDTEEECREYLENFKCAYEYVYGVVIVDRENTLSDTGRAFDWGDGWVDEHGWPLC